MKCLRYYKLNVLDSTDRVTDLNPNLIFGTTVHEALNTMLKYDYEMSVSVFEMAWKVHKDRPVRWDRDSWDDYRSMGITFLRKFDQYQLKRFKYLSGEKRLYAAYEGINLEGTPDAVVEYDGIHTLVDFKTSAYNYDKDRVRASLQLYLYAYLCLRNGIRVDQVMYLPFIKNTGSIQTPLIETIDNDKMHNMLDDMKEYVSLLSVNTTFPKNVNSCIVGTNKCDYFNYCWGKREDV